MKKTFMLIFSVLLLISGCGGSISQEKLDEKIKDFYEGHDHSLYSQNEGDESSLRRIESDYNLEENSIILQKQYIIIEDEEDFDTSFVIMYYFVEDKNSRETLQDKLSNIYDDSICINGDFIIIFSISNDEFLKKAKDSICE